VCEQLFDGASCLFWEGAARLSSELALHRLCNTNNVNFRSGRCLHPAPLATGLAERSKFETQRENERKGREREREGATDCRVRAILLSPTGPLFMLDVLSNASRVLPRSGCSWYSTNLEWRTEKVAYAGCASTCRVIHGKSKKPWHRRSSVEFGCCCPQTSTLLVLCRFFHFLIAWFCLSQLDHKLIWCP
jgi:hypothetical protein